MSQKTKKMTIIAMLCAMAYVVMLVGRVPVVLFLKYDPKDVVITIGGFLFGPLTSLLVSVIVSFVEMFTASETGIIGLVMNVLSTVCFSCTAAFIYKRKRTLAGAVIGLVTGVVLMTGMMLLWNYFITPLFMEVPRKDVVALLVPAILPFNLLKGGLNAAITMLLYKPIVTAFRKARLIPPAEETARTRSLGVLLVAGVVLVSCILLVLVMKGIL